MTLGITGGIGSGKSYVSHLLTEHFGIPVYNCDAEAKRLNVESEEIRQQLMALVGPEVYGADGSLQRKVLADFLFASAENAALVNAITHPVVARDFREWVSRHSLSDTGKAKEAAIVAMECAILFESGFDALVDVVINVSAPTQLCIERATVRDKSSAEAIRRRIALQMSDDERRLRAHYTIENDGRDLIPQIQQLLQDLHTKKIVKK